MTITINNLKHNVDLNKIFKYKVKAGDKIIFEDNFHHSPTKFFTKKVGNALHIIEENTLNDFAVLDNYFSNIDNVHLFGFGENADLSSYFLNSTNDLLLLQSSESCLALSAPIESAIALGEVDALTTAAIAVSASTIGLGAAAAAGGGGGGGGTTDATPPATPTMTITDDVAPITGAITDGSTTK